MVQALHGHGVRELRTAGGLPSRNQSQPRGVAGSGREPAALTPDRRCPMTDVIIRSARVLDMDSGGASVFTLPMPLDIIGDSATGAWSTRKVRAAYAGN